MQQEKTATEEFHELLEENLNTLNMKQGSLIKGTVLDIQSDYVVVNTHLKSEGWVPVNEFKDRKGNINIEVGQEVDLVLESIENGYGETCLSREKAKHAAEWEKLEDVYKNEAIIVGLIVDKVKGGFGVDVNDIRCFLPGSQVDIRPVKDLDDLVGKELEFKVVKMDKKRSNVVVSRRLVLEEETSDERDQLLASLEEGDVIKGVVKNLTDYGAFIDLGGIDGLLHITDMSWKRIKHPRELIDVSDEVNVKILSYDKEKKRVSLGLKQINGDPWSELSKRHPVNSRIFGKVTNITDYGCFVEIENDVEGLVHMSEMDWTNKNIHPNKVVQLGDDIEVMVLEINEERRRVSLGIKQCTPNPWQQFSENYDKNDKVKGKVKSITDFGIFIELEGGIDGLVHLTDLSWTESGESSLRSYKKGDEVEVVVLSIDPERERISLGIKQLVADPLEDFYVENPKGSAVSGTVTAIESKKIVVKLTDDISGCLKLNESTSNLKEGDSIEAIVSSNERKHFLVLLALASEQEEVKTEKKEESPRKRAKMSAPAKTTFGDIIRDKLNKNADDEKEDGVDKEEPGQEDDGKS